ncbi:MAG TPA: hypothetical protein VF747_18150 [Blastocatellia bacterium]|jgi:hypothetical protein
MIRNTELKRLLARTDTDWGEPIVRSPGKLISQALQRQGFLPSHEFIVRFIERLRARRARFDVRRFGGEFQSGCHYRQVGSRFKPRIVVIRGIAVLYRMGGAGSHRVELLGVLPEQARPMVVRARAPGLR